MVNVKNIVEWLEKFNSRIHPDLVFIKFSFTIWNDKTYLLVVDSIKDKDIGNKVFKSKDMIDYDMNTEISSDIYNKLCIYRLEGKEEFAKILNEIKNKNGACDGKVL